MQNDIIVFSLIETIDCVHRFLQLYFVFCWGGGDWVMGGLGENLKVSFKREVKGGAASP